jgi:hypothetical protein
MLAAVEKSMPEASDEFEHCGYHSSRGLDAAFTQRAVAVRFAVGRGVGG